MKTRTPVIVVGLVIVGALLPACVAQSPADDHDTLDLEALLESTTDFQREIIGDGVVTAPEFERALLARRECVADAGAEPGDIYTGSNGELTFDYDITAEDEEEALTIQQSADECLPEYFTDVGAVWAYQRLLSPAERDAMRPDALACLESAGLTGLPDDASVADMSLAIQEDGEISEGERDCLVEFGSLFATYVDAGIDDHVEQ
jgi:hypothetical protein